MNPLILEPLTGSQVRGREVADADLPAFIANALQWMAANSVLTRGSSGNARALELPNNTVLGRFDSGGGLGALSASQLSQILNLATLLAQKSNLGHSHAFVTITGIDWSTLADDRMLARVGGVTQWIPFQGGGGGGIQNPLTQDLNIAGFRIVSGGQELLRYENDQVFLMGQSVLDAEITDPVDGQAAIYRNGKWVNEDLPDTGGGSTGGTGSAGTAFPSDASPNDQFTRLDSLQSSVYRSDLPIKQLRDDVTELDGWLDLNESTHTFRRDDIDLSAGAAYINGDGYGRGLYFPEDVVVSRLSASFGNVVSGTIQARVNVNNGGLQFGYDWDIDTKRADTVQPWMLLRAGTMLSLYGTGFGAAATPEITATVAVRKFTEAALQPTS